MNVTKAWRAGIQLRKCASRPLFARFGYLAASRPARSASFFTTRDTSMPDLRLSRLVFVWLEGSHLVVKRPNHRFEFRRWPKVRFEETWRRCRLRLFKGPQMPFRGNFRMPNQLDPDIAADQLLGGATIIATEVPPCDWQPSSPYSRVSYSDRLTALLPPEGSHAE